MNDDKIKTLEQIQQFIAATKAIDFKPFSQQEGWTWIESILKRFTYRLLGKEAKGILIAYLRKITGYSRQQLTRLISRYVKDGKLSLSRAKRHAFKVVYTRADILLLATLDEHHERLNGLATKKLCERAYLVYKQDAYKRLAGISVSHLYNIRKSTLYRQKTIFYEKTRAVSTPIGVRKKPRPIWSARLFAH